MAAGWPDRHSRRHEEGHARVARKLGYRVDVHADHVFVHGKQDPIHGAAICYGGRVRAGRGGHEEDEKIAEEYLRQLPRAERAAARREAKRLARRYA